MRPAYRAASWMIRVAGAARLIQDLSVLRAPPLPVRPRLRLPLVLRLRSFRLRGRWLLWGRRRIGGRLRRCSARAGSAARSRPRAARARCRVRLGGSTDGPIVGTGPTRASRRPARPRPTRRRCRDRGHGQAEHDPAVALVRHHGRPVVGLDLLEEGGLPVRATVDRRAGAPSSTAATSSPVMVLWVSSAWASTSTSRRFSRSSRAVFSSRSARLSSIRSARACLARPPGSGPWPACPPVRRRGRRPPAAWPSSTRTRWSPCPRNPPCRRPPRSPTPGRPDTPDELSPSKNMRSPASEASDT